MRLIACQANRLVGGITAIGASNPMTILTPKCIPGTIANINANIGSHTALNSLFPTSCLQSP